MLPLPKDFNTITAFTWHPILIQVMIMDPIEIRTEVVVLPRPSFQWKSLSVNLTMEKILS